MRLLSLSALIALGISVLAGPVSAALTADQVRTILLAEQARNTADGVLVTLATDENPEVRVRALRALGRIQDVALMDVLTTGLGDAEPAVRAEAAFAMGQLFDPAAAPALLTALESEADPAVRARLTEGLGKCATDTVLPTLRTLLSDETPEVAQNAAVALGQLAVSGVDITSASPELNRAMQAQVSELQWRAAFAVQRGRIQSGGSGVFDALRSSDTLPVLYATRAAGAIAARALVEKALPSLEHPDWRVRVEGLRAMSAAKLNYYTSRASILLDDPSLHVLLTAIDTMGKLSSGGGLGRITHLESSSDWRIRAAIIQAKAEGSGDGALPDLRGSSRDSNWRIRVAVASALATLKTEHALVLAEEMLTDESPQVLTALANSLVVFPQIHAVVLNRTLLKSRDAAVLTSAAGAAGQRFDYGALELLIPAYDLLQSPVDSQVMTAILQAIGSILTATPEDDPQGELTPEDQAKAEALLEAALHDSDRTVAITAADQLSLIRQTLVDAPDLQPLGVPEQLDLELAVGLESSETFPIARLVTNKGTIVLRLFGPEAPGTVANFVTLARSGYYNGLTFHRVVADFVIQGGDPRGDGWGGPGYSIRCEYTPRAYSTGMVGMALSGKDTGGSQFFITHSPQPHLNGRYTIFGEVIDGMDVVDKIQVGDTITEIQLEGI